MSQNLHKPTYLKELCLEYGLSPSKKYGQNYLITDAPIQKMVEAAGVSSKDTIIEIGPGFGVLTFALVQKAKEVISFEIEKKLVSYWDSQKEIHKNLQLIWGNFLKEFPNFQSQLTNYKVVANLPYQVTSNVLRVLLESEKKPKSITVMVQKEVAERICAKAGDMSLLSVSVQYYGKPKIITKVPSGCFWPAPKVDSAVIHIDVEQSSHTHHADEQFFSYVRAGFSNKRKQLAKNIASQFPLKESFIRETLESISLNPKARAQDLLVSDWQAFLTKLFQTEKISL
ncbi:MAG: ribosomal RNA small subunit methyltransferase A [Candidatus Magasanikbacteria bacterium CG11_big_fil_rev_8_21_14_0_20_39_34]|uniref:Ribosomal RNA small subunit methyltransferase A n=1 Tax=Candidatus Magasanikbacteria bacterium CG11_big_fil_rev_8_21_14_0_20_39_34 TaxID=1974653 RepID=A0A2H0N6F7_9BACT|nr:MAG: ribosomal RNA small subunit methyltransferase A [Candidatus Magasanikbacteria bacterium CG11_big_fil_rev_8_21_14_0_20_39_34]